MKFDTPAGQNPIDQLKVVGKPTDRIDGKYKTTGTAPYAYERHDVVANQAYGYVLGAGVAKGRLRGLNVAAARRAPGVIDVVSTLDTPKLGLGRMNTASLFGGPEIQHYHQAIALVVAETFERAPGVIAVVSTLDTPVRSILPLRRNPPSPSRAAAARGAAAEQRIGRATSKRLSPTRR